MVVPCAYNRPARVPVCRFVTQAEVTFQHGAYSQRHTDVKEDKIRAVLNYLRTTEPYGKADTVPQSDDSYHIILRFSDGTTGIYRQSGYMLFSKNDEPWQKIDSTHAQLLYPLFHLLSTDV